jgi:hypothetical protein
MTLTSSNSELVYPVSYGTGGFNQLFFNIGVWAWMPASADYRCSAWYGTVFSAVAPSELMYLALCDGDGADNWVVKYHTQTAANAQAGTSPPVASGSSVYVGKWVHLGLAVNPNNGDFRVYIDGAMVYSAGTTVSALTTGPLRIGLGAMSRSTPGMKVDDWHVDNTATFEALAHRDLTFVPVLSGAIWGLPPVAMSLFNVTLRVGMDSGSTPAFVYSDRTYGYNDMYSIPVPKGASVNIAAGLPSSYSYPSAFDAVSANGSMNCVTPAAAPITASNGALDLDCITLVAFYRFENNYLDSGPFNVGPAAPSSGVTFTYDPERGAALEITGGGTAMVSLPSPSQYLDLVPPFTVSLWIKLSGVPIPDGVLLRLDSFVLQADDSNIRLTFITSFGSFPWSCASILTQDWALLVVRVKRDMSGTVFQFCNPLQAADSFAGFPGSFVPPTGMRHLGGTVSSLGGNSSFDGLISDVRLFSGVNHDTTSDIINNEYLPAVAKRSATMVTATGLEHDSSATVTVMANTPAQALFLNYASLVSSPMPLSSKKWSLAASVSGTSLATECSGTSSEEPFPGDPGLIYRIYCSRLVASYDFTSSPGVDKDSSPYGHHLTTMTAGAVVLYDPVIGWCLDIGNSADGATSVYTTELSIGLSFTVSFWVRLDPNTSGKIFDLPNLVSVQWDASIKSLVCFPTCGTVPLPGLTSDAWNHITFSVFANVPGTSSYTVSYLNGIRADINATAPPVAINTGTSGISIGYGFLGGIARVRLWRGPRSPKKVLAEYTQTKPERWVQVMVPSLTDSTSVEVMTSSIPDFNLAPLSVRTLSVTSRWLRVGIPASVAVVTFTTVVTNAPAGATCVGASTTGSDYPATNPPVAALLPCADPNGLNGPGWDVEWFWFTDAAAAPASTIDMALSNDLGCGGAKCELSGELRFQSSKLTIPTISNANCPALKAPGGPVPGNHACEGDGIYARFYSTCVLGPPSLTPTTFGARLLSAAGGARVWLGAGPWNQAVHSSVVPAFATSVLSEWDRPHAPGVPFEVVVEWYVNPPNSASASLLLTFEEVGTGAPLNVTCLAYGNVCGDGKRRFREACDATTWSMVTAAPRPAASKAGSNAQPRARRRATYPRRCAPPLAETPPGLFWAPSAPGPRGR